MPPKSSPQAQYGFIEADENPFDDGPMMMQPQAAPQRTRYSQGPPPQQPQQQQQYRQVSQTTMVKTQVSRQTVPGAQYAQPQPPRSQSQTRSQAPPVQQYAQPPPQQYQPQRQVAPRAQPMQQPPQPIEDPQEMPSTAPVKKSGLAGMFAAVSNPFGSKSDESAGITPADDLATREANLRAREEKMARMEMEVEQRERAVKAKENAGKNWPSKCYPILYHSIADEIPTRLQPMIKKFYALVIFTWLCLVINFVTCLVIFFEAGDNGTDPIWAAVWAILGVPGAWSFWYSNVYGAAKAGSSRKYLYYFVGFGMHLLFCLIIGIGTPSMGAGGLLFMIKYFANGYAASGVFALIDTCVLGLNFFISLYLLKVARDAWRTGGGSEDLARDRAKLKMASKAGMAAI